MKKITLFITLILSVTSSVIPSAEKDPKKKKDTIIYNLKKYRYPDNNGTEKTSKPSATRDVNNPNLTEMGYPVCPRQRISGPYIIL